MDYIIDENIVYEVIKTEYSIIKTYYSLIKKIALYTDKSVIAADGVDTAIIYAQLKTWDNVAINTAGIGISFMLSGTVYTTLTDNNGIATMTFTAETAGQYNIMAVCAEEYNSDNSKEIVFDAGYTEVITNA